MLHVEENSLISIQTNFMAKIIKVKNKVESNCINFPVGYIYLSALEINPGQYFGGTWEQIKDVFLLMAGDTYQAGTTGGEATHKLSVAEMPSHQHELTIDSSEGPYHASGVDWMTGSAMRHYAGDMISSTGGNQPHNNMPPYLAVYGYRKIA